MIILLYCPYCGCDKIFNKNTTICPNCNNDINPLCTEHNYDWYCKESLRRYGRAGEADEIMLDEIKANPLFGTKEPIPSDSTPEEESEQDERVRQAMFDALVRQKNPNAPKCPTCGSLNISKLSGAKRAIHGAAFGLFSKTARSQWKCNNCGNLW